MITHIPTTYVSVCMERQREEEGKRKEEGETVGRGGAGGGEGEKKREERMGLGGRGGGQKWYSKVETCSLRCKHLPAPNILLPKVCQ